MNDLIEKVNQWFFDRDLAEGDGLGQLQKLHEEIYELAEARIVNDFSAEVDAVGDITVRANWLLFTTWSDLGAMPGIGL